MAKVGNFKVILNETESKQKYIMKGFLLNSFLFFASILRQSPLTCGGQLTELPATS